jgi:hypothetical protein
MYVKGVYMGAHKVGKITIECDENNNYTLDIKFKKHSGGGDGDDAEDGGSGPYPGDVKVHETIEIAVTNPCTWVKIGGMWRKICW